NLKLGEAKYIIYKLNDAMDSIVVEKEAATDTYDDFLADLPENDCRYAVYNFDYNTPEGVRNKIVFYTWASNVASLKHKMIYASSKGALRKSLIGIGLEILGNDFDEVAYDAVLEKINHRQT
ncbi:cofilin, partial [Mortierella sp. AM989]